MGMPQLYCCDPLADLEFGGSAVGAEERRRNDQPWESIDFLIELLQLCQVDGEINSKNVDWVSLNRRKAVHDMVSTLLNSLDDPSSAIKVDDSFFGSEIGR